MQVSWWFDAGVPIAGAPGAMGRSVTAADWQQAALDFAAGGARLMALWASHTDAGKPIVRGAWAADSRLLVLSLPLADTDRFYPGIETLFPAAGRMQRAIADLSGVRAASADTRPWLRHAAWPESFHPLVDTATPDYAGSGLDNYPFVRVEGEGVHEIAVGPVHAGTIEPGHFRFSVVGEKVLKLEQHLGYTHKGIERRFTQLPLMQAHRLAAHICGDSTVAYTWVYCQALEGMAAATIPERAAWLRALALETERISNHLGDLGALGNDAGFAFGLAQFSILKEQLLRALESALGQRYLMDYVVPGGVRSDLNARAAETLSTTLSLIGAEAVKLRSIYDEHAGIRDRFAGAGTVTPTLAAQLGLTGLAGRASGQCNDLRIDMPCLPYTEIRPRKISHDGGDVAARVAIRFDELQESIQFVRVLLQRLPAGPHIAAVPTPADGALGIGCIEGWRGPVLMALEAGANGTIRRCHPHDPSWQNWPVLEHAIIGNIVPDFPLINKSFNLAYSGNDL